jgi:uncharacterized protein YlaI
MLTVARYSTGEQVNISTLAELKERNEPRPTCFCLACGSRLAAKLGRVRAHHFGHFPQSGPDRCWATSPEGALHINAKALLKRLLEAACASGRTLSVTRRCPRCGRGAPIPTEVIQLNPADNVVVEGWADPRRSFRPDLQVLGAAGEPRLFVEVVVTNSSSDEKLRWALSLAVPLLELQGATVLQLEESASNLACTSAVNVPPRPLCVTCAEAMQANSTRASVDAGQKDSAPVHSADVAHSRSEGVARRPATPLDLARIAEGAEAQAKKLDAEERRRREVLPEARARATARILRSTPALQVAEFRFLAASLRVHASWLGGTVTLDLVAHSGRSIKRWTGTQKEMERALATELAAVARNCLERSRIPGTDGARLVVCEGIPVDAVTGLPILKAPPPEKDPRWVKFMLEEQRRLTAGRRGAPLGPGGSRYR